MNVADFQYAIQTMGWTLVHFLWQGAALGLVYALSMAVTTGLSPRLRYRLGLTVFLAAGAMPVLTFLYLFQPSGSATALGSLTVTASAGAAEPVARWMGLERLLEPYLPWAVALWLAGVAVMSTRVCVDWWQVRRLTRVGVSPLPRHWESTVAGLVLAFQVSRPVRVLRSHVVRVPAVIGWLRPVVLLPSAAITGLSPRQLELIIAHELAHIRRADYLVNLMQVLIETLLFYHPAVRWMSNRLREEREHCCDDAVIGTCGDRLTYAHALTELEEQRQASYQTALAANGGVLSQRIYRMLDRSAPRRSALIWGMSLVVGLAAGSMAVAAQLALNGASPPAPVSAPALEAVSPSPVAAATAETAVTASGGLGAAALRATRTPGPSSRPVDTDDRPTRKAAGDATRAAAEPETRPVPERPATAVDQRQVSRQPEPTRTQPVTERKPAADEGGSRPTAVNEDVPAETAAPGTPDIEKAPVEQPIQLASARPASRKAAPEPEPSIRGGQPIQVTAPEYPRYARLRGLQGSVTAEFTIDRGGRVTDIRVVDSSPAGVFDRAVTDALKDWRFQPLVKDGKPTARRVAKLFEFNLDGGRHKSGAGGADDSACDPLTGTRICRPWSRSDVLEEAHQP